MAADAAFLRNLSPSQLFMHLYEWQGECATYGHFVHPEQYFHLEAALETGLKLARRPTGGGIIFHTCDYAFSLLIGRNNENYRSPTLESYALVNEWVGKIVAKTFGIQPDILVQEDSQPDTTCDRFCMAQPTKFDLILQGRKVGGAAQRRTRQGILHQGSICLTLPPKDYLKKILVHGTALAETMYANSFPLLGPQASIQELKEARQALTAAMIENKRI